MSGHQNHDGSAVLIPQLRAAEKASARAADEAALKSGQKSIEELRRENSFFGNMKFSVDLEYAKKIR
jgi:hypothetical protein